MTSTNHTNQVLKHINQVSKAKIQVNQTCMKMISKANKSDTILEPNIHGTQTNSELELRVMKLHAKYQTQQSSINTC
jgi:CO dehydrogenase/acetyl-CoA synthase epsilon subunit